MAKATAFCTCNTCGKDFVVTKYCYNRTDASSFEAYAENAYDECPECYGKRMKTEREKKRQEDAAKSAEIIEHYHFPSIIGRTEKQTKYAEDLRNRYLAEIANQENAKTTFGNFETYLKLRETEEYKNEIKKHAPQFGGDMSKSETAILEYGGINTLVKLYKIEDAKTIIDILK